MLDVRRGSALTLSTARNSFELGWTHFPWEPMTASGPISGTELARAECSTAVVLLRR
eukprot:COSAG04_NODE_32172_length_252_cov_1.019608_1_plen_56_part_01